MKSKNLTQSKLGWVVQRPLLLILLISVILRVGAAFYMGDTVIDLPGIFDQISYHNLALRVAGGNGFSFGELWWPITPANAPTAHWSFLYTLYLTLIYILFSPHPIIARIIQAIIVGILHPYITYRIGEKVFNRNVGLAAAAVTAIYIYFFYYGAALMTEPFYITTIVLSLYMALLVTESRDIKREIWLGVALGVSIGIALLLRQVYLLFLPFLFLWVWIVRFRQNRSLPIVSTGISIALIVVFVLPVTLYNYSRFDRFVLLNTNSGYAFFWGNNPIYGTKFIPILPTEAYRDMIPEELRHLDEAALDQELLKRGMQFVMDDPQRYVLLSLSRIPPYFKFWYSADSGTLSNISRIASFGVTLPFMIYGLVLGVKKILAEKGNRLWNLIVSPIGLLLLFTVVYSGVHILTWTLVRYRLPVDAVLIPFAGLALVDIAERITKRRLQVVTE
jgi:4-amino-4-deoxy-L-arabinose transferase-like glycosyltransferase